MSNFYLSRLTRLRRTPYFVNNYKLINSKKEERFSDIRLKNINFDLLVVFYTVVVIGSISKASKHLLLSQPAISLSLKKIERETGSLLFKQFTPNTKKSIVLTPFGLILFNHIQRLFQIVEESLNFSTQFYSSFTNNRRSLTQQKSFVLLNQFNKNYLFHLNSKSTILKIFYKNLDYFNKINRNYFENDSNLIILQDSHRANKKLEQSNSMSKNLLVDKQPSFKNLNDQMFFSVYNKTTLELQTTNAIKLACDLKISSFTYWGSFA